MTDPQGIGRIVAVEEHFLTEDWLRATAADAAPASPYLQGVRRHLLDTSEARIAAMDDQGVDVQVLSLNSAGLQAVDSPDAPHLAVSTNDSLHATVDAHPDRFQGFAALPTAFPEAAADELQRTVTQLGFAGALINGRTFAAHCDDRSFDVLYGVAETLGVPVFLHPQTPADPIRQSYYSGFAGGVSAAFATSAVGWHYETGVQLLRMIIGGVFDRFPALQVIVGHWGELVLFFLDRTVPQLDAAGLTLARSVSEVLATNIWVTGSGILSEKYLRWAIETIGSDRILTSTDYPWVDNSRGRARAFIHDADLTVSERRALASGNWDALAGRRTA